MNVREYIAIDNQTSRVELVELTEVAVENLSEIATVMSVEILGGKITVWRNRVPSVIAVDTGSVMELKRRAVWRGSRGEMLS